MSISSEIARLKQAKEDIKDAIENQGVEVDDNAKLDEYAELIDDIEGGGPEYEFEPLIDISGTWSVVRTQTVTVNEDCVVIVRSGPFSGDTSYGELGVFVNGVSEAAFNGTSITSVVRPVLAGDEVYVTAALKVPPGFPASLQGIVYISFMTEPSFSFELESGDSPRPRP